MHELNTALDQQTQKLDTVLLRLTTLRLLMASGKHRMVAPTIEELESSFALFETAESTTLQTLAAVGYPTFEDAIAALDPAEGAVLQQKVSAFRALHRDVRVAMASTGSAADSAIRQAASGLPTDSIDLTRQSGRHPFLTGDR